MFLHLRGFAHCVFTSFRIHFQLNANIQQVFAIWAVAQG